MAWPLIKWIMYSSSSSSSSSDEEYVDSKGDSVTKESDDRHRVSNKHGEQDEEDDNEDDDVSYEPQEDETSNSSDFTFTTLTYEPRSKRRRIENKEALTAVRVKRRKRVWSHEDELELLKNFLDYRTRPRAVNDATSFYDEVNPKFKEQFTKRHLAEKLGRLKKKYRNLASKLTNNDGNEQEFRFRKPHDKAIFDISQAIWSNVQDKNVVVDSHDVGSSKTYDEKATTSLNNGNDDVNIDVRGLILGLGINIPVPLSLSNYGGGGGGEVVDEKWRDQQILELEAYSKRLELVQNQVKAALDDLKSK